MGTISLAVGFLDQLVNRIYFTPFEWVNLNKYTINIYLYIRTRTLKLFLFCILFASSYLNTEAYSGHTYICLFFLLNLSTTTIVVVIIC